MLGWSSKSADKYWDSLVHYIDVTTHMFIHICGKQNFIVGARHIGALYGNRTLSRSHLWKTRRLCKSVGVVGSARDKP